MDYRHRHNNIVFLYHYLVGLYLLTASAMCTQGLAQAWITFIVGMAVCYFVMRFKESHISKKEKSQQGEKRCHLLVLSLAVIVTLLESSLVGSDLPEVAQNGAVPGVLLLTLLLMGIFFVFLYADYYQEKYLTMYANFCVTPETIRRFEKNNRVSMKKFMFVLGGVLLSVMLLSGSLWSFNPEVEQMKQEQEEENTEKQNKRQIYSERMRQIEKKREEEQDGTFAELLLAILFRIVQILIVVLAVGGVAALIYFFMRRLFGVRLPEFEWVRGEKETTGSGQDEYTALDSRPKKRANFPSDANGKIRRYFYQFIRRGAKSRDMSIDASLTPQELARAYLPGAKESLTEAQENAVKLYEKARYSCLMCSEEEAERMRQQTVR